MKILFIGGNGNISWWCVQRTLDAGQEVFEVNRKMTRSTRRAVQHGVQEIVTDIKDELNVAMKIKDLDFDVVCDFVCFNATDAESRLRLFENKCRQYVVISSEAVYKRDSQYLPFRETTPQYDESVGDTYIAGKICMEKAFMKAYRQKGFPVTIVRPGYTYDTIIQMPVGQNCFTAPQMLMEGYPFLMPGEGYNLVAPLHSSDFAAAFVKLLGNSATIGQDYHIAAEWLITWNEMAEYIMDALDIKAHEMLHIPHDEAVYITDFYSETVNQQHMWHYIFDNSKIKEIADDWKQTIAFREGIKRTVSWLFEDNVRQRINKDYRAKLMDIYVKYYCGGLQN